jgi:acyl carrier protein phosphodiesterase
MNFLAHIYLSGNDDYLKIGNFIADSIRGNKYLNYPKEIQKGIILHRHIDTFTDSHNTVKLSKKRLFKKYGHYASVIVDILYDHFLAKNWRNYSDVPLEDYVQNFYTLLKDNFDVLPIPVQKMYPYMIKDNWLLSYASIDGITKVLEGMNRRTKNKSKMNLAVQELQEFYVDFEEDFTSFFKELILFTDEEIHKTSLLK